MSSCYHAKSPAMIREIRENYTNNENSEMQETGYILLLEFSLPVKIIPDGNAVSVSSHDNLQLNIDQTTTTISKKFQF